MTKLTSFENPREECHIDGVSAPAFALDSWSAEPRLWIGGAGHLTETLRSVKRGWSKGVEVYEDAGGTFRKIMDFDEMAIKADGARYLGRWTGSIYGKLTCDVTRNRLYYSPALIPHESIVVDLESGEYVGHLRYHGNNSVDDIAIDKKGYIHCHFNPGFYMQGVGRLDPDRKTGESRARKSMPGDVPNPRHFSYAEVPYDYGVFRTRSKGHWTGILPVKDQPGSKYFQDGLGVNMRGEVAVQSNIYYVPKMQDEGHRLGWAGYLDRYKTSGVGGDPGDVGKLGYAGMMRSFRELEKKGEKVYFIKRQAGFPLAGGTVWTYEATGELRAEAAAIAGDLINGVQIDEHGSLYLVNARIRVADKKGTPFLYAKGGIFGEETTKPRQRNPLTGTLLKTRGKNARVLLNKAIVPMDPPPDRPPDLIATGWAGETYLKNKNSWAWVEGAYWLYAGASPITFRACSCPMMRFHTDWFQRTFVPESYRHSIGVLDTNGNLIMHIGRYGNLDSGDGPESAIPVGGDGIATTFVRFVAGTDDRLVFDDHGERIVVLKMNYHAEETVAILTE